MFLVWIRPETFVAFTPSSHVIIYPLFLSNNGIKHLNKIRNNPEMFAVYD